MAVDVEVNELWEFTVLMKCIHQTLMTLMIQCVMNVLMLMGSVGKKDIVLLKM